MFNGLTTSIAGNAPGTGFASYLLPIPADVVLRGVPLAGQWLVVDPLGPAGASSSRAFELTVL